MSAHINQSTLEHFAHYVWWEDSNELMRSNPLRIIASAMRYANSPKEYALLCKIDKGVLQEALKKAQAGWFDDKSWHYWHIMLYGENAIIPALPKRSFLQS